MTVPGTIADVARGSSAAVRSGRVRVAFGPGTVGEHEGATFRGGFRASAEAPGRVGNAGGAARWPGGAGKPARTSAAGRDADARTEERLAPVGRSSRVCRDGEDVMGGTTSNMAREGTA